MLEFCSARILRQTSRYTKRSLVFYFVLQLVSKKKGDEADENLYTVK